MPSNSMCLMLNFVCISTRVFEILRETTLYCRLQCTVVLVGVVLKGLLGGTTF